MTVSCRNLTKKYGAYSAVNNISLTLGGGRIIGLLGPNGSGKTTLIKMINGLLTPSSGELLIDGRVPGVESKKHISYLAERTYLNMDMRVRDLLRYFADFYADFDMERAHRMLDQLEIQEAGRLKTMSKGTKEKVQLILVMSRRAQLYVLDEPIGGIDPAGRDYILDTILTNFDPGASILLSTHLIADIERILDDVIFLRCGTVALYGNADEIRGEHGKSIDALFREVYRC